MFVLDASVTLSWHFDDEGDGSEDLAQRALERGVAVPSHWMVEVVNGLLRGERRRRTDPSATSLFLERIADIDVDVDLQDAARVQQSWLAIARRSRLSIYDAGYLELAQRLSIPIATLDTALAAAAHSAGVPVIGPLATQETSNE